MDGEKSSGSGKNKQTREQDKHRRRHLNKAASHDRGLGGGGSSNSKPVFGKPIEKKDSELHKITLNVLGDYDNYKNAMEWTKQRSYFGVADATPSTPIQGSKYNPFEGEFRAATSSSGAPTSSDSSLSGKAASRHQVAELPASSQHFYNKKDKSRTKPHPKHSSKVDSLSQRPTSSLATAVKTNKDKETRKSSALVAGGGVSVDGSSDSSQATNVLKSKHKKVRPYKSQATGSSSANAASSLSAQSKTSSSQQNPSLFDFSTPTVSSNTLSNPPAIHRTSSSSSATSSKHKHLTPSDRSSSFTSIPVSRHNESHVTANHSSTSGKHKKLASVPPLVGVASQKPSEREQDERRVVSIKRTNSLEFVKQPSNVPVGEEPGRSESAASHSSSAASVKKKKKTKKKQKKDKAMADAGKTTTTVPISAEDSYVPTSHGIGHVTSSQSHMTSSISTAATSKTVNVETVVNARSRPSDLRITSQGEGLDATTQEMTAEVLAAGVGTDDVSQDAGDVQSMLDELMKPLEYSVVTPIPTPIKSRPFVFPAKRPYVSDLSSSERKTPSISESTGEASLQRAGPVSVGRLHKLSTSSSDGESDGDNKMAVEMAMSALDFNLAKEQSQEGPASPAPQRPASPALSVSSSSSSGESSSESSDSSSEGEGEGEESETNITPTLEKLHRQVELSGAAITPLKKTPPRVGLSSLPSMISPLADESANLSPAKPAVRHSLQSHSDNSLLVNQVSMGFVPVSNSSPMPSMLANIMSDTSDSDSGSESDSESSDSEDESSGNENIANKTDGRGTIGSAQSSAELEEVTPAPPPFGSSSGFWDDACDILGAASGFGEQRTPEKKEQDTPTEFMDTSEAPPISRSTEEKETSRASRKRKLNSDAPLSLRKAQKLMSRVQDVDEKEELPQKSLRPVGVAVSGKAMNKKKVQSSLSDREMSEEDEEEGEIPSDEEEGTEKPPYGQQGVEVSINESQLQRPTSASSLRFNHGGANSSKSPFIKQEVVEEDEGEPQSLVVRFQLTNIPKLPMQKPKATVEPFYHRSTSTSKVTKRRNTVDAPGERDGDEVQPRGLSRERGERNMYNSRHREDYGRDYHRPPRSHRDSSARWDRESSRDRRIYGSSDERSGRHGSSRHGGWDRDGDYHRDDYWMDGGGSHYDRGTRDYERGSRQRGDSERKRGAEYFIQEARKRKHEADKISIPGVDKAKAYMESVPYFLRHGDAIEVEQRQQNQQWAESGGGALKRNPFKMYSDTLGIVRFCQNMAGDCKPLVVACLRCQSVLLWRMFQLKQTSASHIQKELQEFFVLPKGTQSKSPYPNNFSPLPSPASVSSTASNGSGGGTFTQDPSPSGNVSVPKHIFNRASEHLTISGYLNQSFDTWKVADTMTEQCREFFMKAERKTSRLYQFSSSITQTASWVENVLRNI